MAAISIADLRKEAPRSRRAAARKALSVTLALCALAVAGLLASYGPMLPQAKTAQLENAPALSREAAFQGVAALSGQENLYAAVNAVLSAWQAQAVEPMPGQAASLNTLVRQRGLTATRVSGGLEALARLDAPALLHVAVPGAGDRLVALVGLDRDAVRVVPSIAGRATLTRAELALIWSGGATLLWKDFHAISSHSTPAEKAARVRLLQGLLKQAGCYSGAQDGRHGTMTRAALVEFQTREQLVVDGEANGQTLMLLYRRAGGFFPPGLDRAGDEANGAGGSTVSSKLAGRT